MNLKTLNNILRLAPFLICALFLLAYLILSVIKHAHYLSGYDLAVLDQAIYKYSQFKNPITTIHAYYDTPVFFDHFEPILLLISPIYWVFKNTAVLFFLQTFGICISGFLMFKLAIQKRIKTIISLALLSVYLSFYGIQNAVWADVHTTVFAIPFLALLIYLLEQKKYKLAAIPFFLAIICKEDMALFTFIIALIQFVATRQKILLLFMAGSIVYLLFVFGIFFPNFTDGYRFQNNNGLLSNIDIKNMVNTPDKRESIFYGLLSFGFIPLFVPFYLLLPIFDLAHYFILGSNYVTSAQGLFLHYRSTLALFLIWPTIIALSKFKQLNRTSTAFYLILCLAITQYVLHLPLSYLVKAWFWKTPPAAHSINNIIKKVPANASVATQVNISAHLSHRDETYLLWPATREFKEKSPCDNPICEWMRIGKSVNYIIVDTSSAFDARHFLQNREEFIKAIENLKKAKVIEEIVKEKETVLYKVVGKI